MVVTSTIRYSSTKKKINFFWSGKCGIVSSRWPEACKLSMRSRSCTEISNRPTFSLSSMALLNLVTWMFPSRPKKMVCSSRRLARPIMHRQRYGKISPTIIRVIYGLWAVSSTKWSHCRRLSKLQIWTCFTRRSNEATIKKYPVTIVKV